jgi:mono/diheme cytochrome c family protein
MAGKRVALLFLFGTAASTLFMAGCGKKVPPEPMAPGDIMDYKVLFAQNCAACHGENGLGGPAMRLNDPVYLSLVPSQVIHDTIANGRPGTPMPAFSQEHSGPLNPKQIDALVNGIEQNWGKPRVDPKSLPPYAAQSAGDPRRGLAVFSRACALCHGDRGPAGSIRDPAFLSLISNQNLRTIVIVGRAQFAMPDFRSPVHMLGRPMTDREITDVVAYLASLRPAEAQVAHAQESGSGMPDASSRGNEGSGYGPRSPHLQKEEGNKTGKSSMPGGK